MFCTSSTVFSDVKYKDQVSVSMGMVNSSFSQQEGAISDSKTASSGSVSVIALDLSYEFFFNRRFSFFLRGTGSGLAGEISKYFSFSGGQRFYFGADGTSAKFKDNDFEISTVPVFRYYAGWTAGTFYMIYEPKKEVRSDIGVEFGGLGGILFSADPKSSYKCELTVLKGSGTETTSMDIQVFFGASYFVNSFF